MNRIIKTFTSTNYDLDYDGVRVPIRFKVVTGQWLIDQNLYTTKGFKRIILYYKPEGTHQHDVKVKIDNIALDPTNTIVFSEAESGDLLGVNFILGQSILGFTAMLSGYTKTLDGIGNSCQIIIENNNISQTIELQGLAVEFEFYGESFEAGSK